MRHRFQIDQPQRFRAADHHEHLRFPELLQRLLPCQPVSEVAGVRNAKFFCQTDAGLQAHAISDDGELKRALVFPAAQRRQDGVHILVREQISRIDDPHGVRSLCPFFPELLVRHDDVFVNAGLCQKSRPDAGLRQLFLQLARAGAQHIVGLAESRADFRLCQHRSQVGLMENSRLFAVDVQPLHDTDIIGREMHQ